MILKEGNEAGVGCGRRGLSLGSQAGETSDPGNHGGQETSLLGGVHSRVLGSQLGASVYPSVLSASPPTLTDLLPLPSLAGTDALGHDAPSAAVCFTAGVTGLSLVQLVHVSVRHGRRCLGAGWREVLVERELQKVLVTEGGPGALHLATAFVLFGGPQPLSWSPLNLFCPGPARVHKDLLLKPSGN